jgi:FkbM family methyltransferase
MLFIHRVVQKLLSLPKFTGRDYLIMLLPYTFIKKPKGECIIKTRFGFRIKINPIIDPTIEMEIYYRGVYELGTIHFLQSHLKKGNHFVDIGANIGFLSLAAANLVDKKGKVFAFEPVKSTFQILEENIKLNHSTNLILYPFAVGKDNRTVKIKIKDGNKGRASIVDYSDKEGELVEIRKLDDVLKNQKVDCIKIDVEGHELDVLIGASEIIKSQRPILIIEYSLGTSKTPHEVFNWIKNIGFYTVFKLKMGKERKSKLIPINFLEDLPDNDNIFCISSP